MKKIIVGTTIMALAFLSFFSNLNVEDNDKLENFNLDNLSLIKQANAETDSEDGKIKCYGAYKTGDDFNVPICGKDCPTQNVKLATDSSLCP